MRRWAALVTNTVFLHGNSAAVNIFADPSASVEHRSDTLQNITVVESGQFIIAKLQCYGCPTTARLEKGGHQITHEENALFFNISSSSNRSQLLLNSEPIFPYIPSPPPKLYAPQIPLNFSLSSLSSAIECTQQPCADIGGKCNCIAHNLGGMGLSYDYYAFSSSASGGWIIRVDVIGGHNGYMKDPYVEFDSPQQRVLQIDIEQHQNGHLEILDSTRLVERMNLPADLHQELSTWGKVLKFFGFDNDQPREDGHVVYFMPERDIYGRVGTLMHLLHEIWAKWGLIVVIVVSIFGGLILFYGIFKLVVLVYKSPRKEQGAQSTDNEDKWDETGRLLDDDEEEPPIRLEDLQALDLYPDTQGMSPLLGPKR